MKCPACHTENDAAAAFCENCGAPLIAPPVTLPSENRTVILGAPAPAPQPQGRRYSWRSWQGALFAGLLVLGLAAAAWYFLFAGSSLFGDDEAMFRANARRTAEYDGGGTLPSGREKWSSPVMHESFENIIEYDGNIYVSTRKDGNGSSTRTSSTTRTGRDHFTGNIYSFSAEDGSRTESLESKGYVRMILGISDGIAYALSGTDDEDWELIAFDLESGEEMWDFSDNYDLDLETLNFLVVADETVYFALAPDSENESSHLYALDALTGEERWKFETDLPARTVAASDDIVYFSATRSDYSGDEKEGCLFAIDAESGRELWKFEKDMVMAGVVVGDDAVYVQAYDIQYADYDNNYDRSYDGHIYAVEARSGKEKWDYKTDQDQSEIALADNVIFVSENGGYYTDEGESYLQAIDAGTGQKLWKYDHGTGGLKSPIVADGVVYAMGAEGGDERYDYKFQLVALDAKSGSRSWKYDLAGHPLGDPIISEGKIFFLSCAEGDDDDCDLVALE